MLLGQAKRSYFKIFDIHKINQFKKYYYLQAFHKKLVDKRYISQSKIDRNIRCVIVSVFNNTTVN